MRPTVKLSEICKFQNGFAFKSELFKPKGEPILRISNIQKENISDEKLVFFDLNDYDNLDTYIVNPGELVIAMSGATTGKIAMNNTNKKYYLNQRVGKFSFDNDITKEYCHYFLGTKVEENLNKAAGAAIQNLSSKQILDIEIPLPPLEIQKAIVAKLDQIFAELDQTKLEIQKNLDNTDELRKSALNQAFQGDWEMKKLGDIAEFQNGFAFKSELFKSKGEPILRISNIQKDNISDEKLVFFDLKDYDNLDTYIVSPGELVIAMSGATTGKIAINNTNKQYYLNQRVGKFGFDNDITKEYCHYFLGTKVEENLNKAAGAAIQNLSSKQILDIKIPVPPLSEQEKIVEHLDQVSKEVKALKSQYQSQLDNLEELKKSVLDKAFRGELGE